MGWHALQAIACVALCVCTTRAQQPWDQKVIDKAGTQMAVDTLVEGGTLEDVFANLGTIVDQATAELDIPSITRDAAADAQGSDATSTALRVIPVGIGFALSVACALLA